MYIFDVGVVVPTYNEKDNIVELLSRVLETAKNNMIKVVVQIMDDSSPDGTAEIVKQFALTHNSPTFEIRLHVRAGKMGLASAYKTGFSMIQTEAEYLLSMDADLSHQPEYLPELLKIARAGSDLVIGSRYVKGGGIEGWSKYRLFLSRMGSLYARTILGVPINDFTGGYNLYHSEIFNKLALGNVKAEGYLFQIEMKYRIAKLSLTYSEFPIVFIDRVRGQSKISRSIILEAFLGVVRLRFS